MDKIGNQMVATSQQHVHPALQRDISDPVIDGQFDDAPEDAATKTAPMTEEMLLARETLGDEHEYGNNNGTCFFANVPTEQVPHYHEPYHTSYHYDERRQEQTRQCSPTFGAAASSTTTSSRSPPPGYYINQADTFPRRGHYVSELNHNDVICGRGKGANDFVGNKRFRALVKSYREKYLHSPRGDKVNIARLIMEIVKQQSPPGRFLKKLPKSRLWHEVEKHVALEKTSQALMREIRGIGIQEDRKRKRDPAEPARHTGPQPSASIAEHDRENYEEESMVEKR